MDNSHIKRSKGASMAGKTHFRLTSKSNRYFQCIPPEERLPRGETMGGYIFLCNRRDMEERLYHQVLFGLPHRYRDSVRVIQPGLPVFLFNSYTNQLYGIFEASSFGGFNIDPTAWENKRCRGQSRFPAQVRVRVRRLCKAISHDNIKNILHYLAWPKFRLELSVPQALRLLDFFNAIGPPSSTGQQP